MTTFLSRDLPVGITTDIAPGLPAFFWTPSSPMVSAVLHGLFTTLAIKEAITVTRFFVKGSSSVLRVNRTILWDMVENWEDALQTLFRLVLQRPLHTLPHDGRNKQSRLTRKGYGRFLVSFIIALWLFGFEMGLIMLSVPRSVSHDVKDFTKIQWLNNGTIPTVTQSNVLRGDIHENINFKSNIDDIAFLDRPLLNFHRSNADSTDFFRGQYYGRLFSCNIEHNIICSVLCENNLYEYRLELSFSTRSGKFLLVPTDKFKVQEGAKNHLKDYAREITRQFGISIDESSLEMGNNTHFEIRTMNTTTPPPELTLLKYNETMENVFTHDAIATLFFGSIAIYPAPKEETYLEKIGHGSNYQRMPAKGLFATSKRPPLPLLGIIIIYAVLQLISLIQQEDFDLQSHSNELTALLEVTGGDTNENPANVHVENRPLISSMNSYDSELAKGVVHVGYLLASVVADIKEFLKEGGTDAGKERYEIIVGKP